MPPKVKITKTHIINAALDIIRKKQPLNARTLAATLNCSTQPIFSNFATMEELRLSVLDRATEIYNDYIRREIENEECPAYKASGLAYIRFAREERELFKLLYMQDHAIEIAPETIDFGAQIESIVQNSTGLSQTDWKLFHLEMWAYVHGIASMIATGFADPGNALVSRMLTDAYMGMRKQYGLE